VGKLNSGKLTSFKLKADGLASLTVQQMTEGFQVTDKNVMVGLEGRSNLLRQLSNVLNNQPEYFPSVNNTPRRPGNLIGKCVQHDIVKYTLRLQ
jgi:hypothetical protein